MADIPILTQTNSQDGLEQVSEAVNNMVDEYSTQSQEIIKALNGIEETSVEQHEEILKTEEENKEENESTEDKKESKFKSTLTKIGNGFTTALDNSKEALLTGFLGAGSLLVKPMEDLFGFNLAESLSSGMKGLFQKGKSKRKPTPSDVAKDGDSGSLLLYHFFKGKKTNSGGDEDEEGGFFSKLLSGGGAGGLAGALSILGGVALIAGGVFLAIRDAIAGMDLAKEWGVSKLSGFIGGFLGGTESGWSGAFKNMGKWALAGAGIGLIAGGPVGAIVGGVIGAALGAILGFIGGEKIAQGLENTKQALSDIWGNEETNLFQKITMSGSVIMDSISNGLATFFATIPVMIASLFTKDEDKLAKIQEFFKEAFKISYELIFNPVAILKRIVEGVGKLNNWLKKQVKDRLKPFFSKTITGISDVITGFFGNIGSSVSSGLLNAGEFFLGIWEVVKETFFNLITGAGDVAVDTGEFFTGLWTNVSGWIGEKIFDPLLEFFEKIGEYFSNIAYLWEESDTGDRLQNVTNYATGGLLGTDRRDAIVEELLLKKASDEELAGAVDNRTRGSIDDGIIKSDGTIIRTHPDDNIIATKNDPILNGMSTGEGNAIALTSDVRIVDKLQELITAIGSSNLGNTVVNNIVPDDVEQYRQNNEGAY